ncbi:MAG TPA: hypothetical protein VH765_15230 [Xanthobacteraceae bacterium]|jgi:hypothetical protein
MKLFCFGLLFVVCQPVDEPPSRVTVAVCPIAAHWSANYQKRIAAELRALPPGSAIESAIAEALSLRDQARACAEGKR